MSRTLGWICFVIFLLNSIGLSYTNETGVVLTLMIIIDIAAFIGVIIAIINEL